VFVLERGHAPMGRVCKQVCLHADWPVGVSVQNWVCLQSPTKRCNQAGHVQLIDVDERLLGTRFLVLSVRG